MKSFAAIALAFLIANNVDAANIDIAWSIQPYDDATAQVGDTITFSFAAGQHNVYLHPTGTCDNAGAIEVGVDPPVSYTFTDADAGQSLFFVCEFSGHCDAGQHITVVVEGAGETTEAPTSMVGMPGETTEAPTGMVGIPGETMMPTAAATMNTTDAATAADTPADTAGTTDTATGADTTPDTTADTANTAVPGETLTMMPTRMATQMPGSGASAASMVASLLLAATAMLAVVN